MNVIADFIGQIVQVFYGLTGDYGIAIVMITLSIKLLLLPMNIKQRKQLEKQKEVSQKVAEIQKKYANNQNKMNEELQKVYAENGLGRGAFHKAGFTCRKNKRSTDSFVRTPFHTPCAQGIVCYTF